MEVALITAALEIADWAIGGRDGAARILDIPASTLRDRIRRFGIARR
jgi:transcriptional regulator with GAF, ATPase, and Fis domain